VRITTGFRPGWIFLLFFDFPVFRQDTTPHPTGYRYNQADPEAVRVNKQSHQKHYQPHQTNKADVSYLGISRHVTTSYYFMLPTLRVSVHIIHYACCYLRFTSRRKYPSPLDSLSSLSSNFTELASGIITMCAADDE
jgi:hypothetical protein